MFVITRTFCIVIFLCSVALLTLNSSLPAPVDNNPIWSSTGATHVIHTDETHGNHTLRARLAAFGTNVEDSRLINVSITTDRNLGCSKADFPSSGLAQSAGDQHDQDSSDDSDNWILLMRGECSFVDKVRNAQEYGYGGVIVGDDGSSYDSLITMFAKFTGDVSIPSVFVTHQSYTVLRAAAEDSGYLMISIMATEMRTDWPLLDTLIFICFSPLCTLLIVYVVLFLRRRRMHLNNILPPAYLDKLETVEYMAKDGVNAECVICLETFEDEEHVLELPCKHLYHGDCIRKWLIERKKICPICKRDVSVGIDVREGRLDESAIEAAAQAADRDHEAEVGGSSGPNMVSSPALETATEDTPLLRTAATQTQSTSPVRQTYVEERH